MFSGISNIEEVAFNALSFVWNPSEEAKVKKHTGAPTSLSNTLKATEQVELLEEKRGKVEQVGEGEKEWLRWEGRNPRNVFGPEALVTTAG